MAPAIPLFGPGPLDLPPQVTNLANYAKIEDYENQLDFQNRENSDFRQKCEKAFSRKREKSPRARPILPAQVTSLPRTWPGPGLDRAIF